MKSETEKQMSDAELTVRHCIFGGIIDHWHNKNAEAMRDSVMEKLFDPATVWAIEQYLQELEEIRDIQPIPKYGTVMTAKAFKEAVQTGMFNDDDGYGKYINDDDMMTSISVSPGDRFNDKFKKLIWFNK